MITDAERLARIGELLRLRGLIMVTHEEQLGFDDLLARAAEHSEG